MDSERSRDGIFHPLLSITEYSRYLLQLRLLGYGNYSCIVYKKNLLGTSQAVAGQATFPFVATVAFFNLNPVYIPRESADKLRSPCYYENKGGTIRAERCYEGLRRSLVRDSRCAGERDGPQLRSRMLQYCSWARAIL
jgi:hypothetical protein